MIGQAIERVKTVLENTEMVRRVIFSDPDEFLTFKTNFFPAAHLDVGEVQYDDNAPQAMFTIIIADTIDETEVGVQEKEEQLIRSLDTTLVIASRVLNELQQFSVGDEFQMDQESNPTITRVYEQGTSDYYGWSVTFPVYITNVAHNE